MLALFVNFYGEKEPNKDPNQVVSVYCSFAHITRSKNVKNLAMKSGCELYANFAMKPHFNVPAN